MKNKSYTICCSMLIWLLASSSAGLAQWVTNGPYGGPVYSVKSSGGNMFAGSINGVYKSSDGATWTAANSGIERKTVNVLAVNGNSIYAGIYGSGVYLSTNNGTNWAQKNNGLTDLNIISLISNASELFAGTASGVFYSPDNGQTWSMANNGFPATYPAYSLVKVGNKVFGGSYGLGLYSSGDNGGTWSSVGGGFPAGTFVYALISESVTIYAGTSAGVYKSVDGGTNWVSANTGFPSGMWAKSFAIKPGYIFAGTYSEGIFVSTNNGNSWTQIDNGIPDLPFPFGLPHNYPSIESLETNGSTILAATVDGMYRSTNNGTSWSESDNGILGTDITAVAANNNIVYSGSDRTGVYISTNKGNTWTRANNGLTSYNVIAMATTNSWAYVSVSNTKVFRSNDNGSTWTPASSGLPAAVAVFKSDSSRVIALTQGAQFTPPGIFQTVNNGTSWTSIPNSTISGMSALGLMNQKIYAGTTNGNLYLSSNNGNNWQDISSTLPSDKLTVILPTDSVLYVGLESQGIYKSVNNGGTWTSANTGLSNLNIRDLVMQNAALYAATWGGGVYTSTDKGTSWTTLNSGLNNLFVKNITEDASKVYAGTDAGVYSNSTMALDIKKQERISGMEVFPNPGSGRIYLRNLKNQNLQIIIYNQTGELVYTYNGMSASLSTIDISDKAKGIYFMKLFTPDGISVQKIIVQ